MYIVLTKNSNNTWDAISELDDTPASELVLSLDEAFLKGVPLVGMDVTPYKSKAVKGAKWDGSSFSGGTPDKNVPLDNDEIWNKRQKYSFLSDNEILISFIVDHDNAKSEMFKVAFSGETILVKNLSRPIAKVGKTFTLDGLELTIVE